MRYLNTKPGSIEEVAANMSKYAAESEYQDMFKKELEKAGKGIGAMTPKEKKAFFNKIDSKYTAKDEAVDNPYAVGMAQAMKAKDDQPPLKKSTITKAHDIAKSIEKDQKEEVSQKEIDKFHKSLDKLVHKSFGYSSDEKKKEIKEEDAYQNDRFAVSGNTAKIDNANTSDKSNHVHAPNAKTAVAMYKAGIKSYKDTDDMRKKFPMAVEEVQETHSFVTNKQNEKQKKVGGEKDIVDPAPSIKKESLYDSIKSVWQISAEEMDKIKSEAKYYKKEQNKNDLKSKKIADTGSKSTPVDVEPKVEL
jgi:hypothetical protein